jgi:RNA polymerase sigma-70 factor (ECF subfamily)
MGGRERYESFMEQLPKATPPIPADNADALFAEYADTVYRLAFLRTKSAADADDILQDVFLRALRAKPEWKDASHQKAWFLKVTINCSKSLLTSAWRRHTAPEDENLLTVMQTTTEVYPYVLALPEKYRTVVHLYYYEGYRVNEIAKLLGTSENTVKSHLFRARDMLREQLKGEFQDV